MWIGHTACRQCWPTHSFWVSYVLEHFILSLSLHLFLLSIYLYFTLNRWTKVFLSLSLSDLMFFLFIFWIIPIVIVSSHTYQPIWMRCISLHSLLLFHYFKKCRPIYCHCCCSLLSMTIGIDYENLCNSFDGGGQQQHHRRRLRRPLSQWSWWNECLKHEWWTVTTCQWRLDQLIKQINWHCFYYCNRVCITVSIKINRSNVDCTWSWS